MATNAPLVVLEVLSSGVWVGSFVCLAVVTGAARRVLDGPAQVDLFLVVGRHYAIVGPASLLCAIATGLAMAWPPRSWSGTTDGAVALAGLLVLASAAGMAQARAMRGLRQRSHRAPKDEDARRAVSRGRRVATLLRALMASLTLGIVVLAGLVIAHGHGAP